MSDADPDTSTPDLVIPIPTHASTVHVAVNNSDFVVVFAVIRSAWNHTQGLIPGGLFEPVATVSLAPIAAKQLLRQLTHAINSFEKVTNTVVPDFGTVAFSEEDVMIGPSDSQDK